MVTNVGGVYEAAKAKPKELFTILYQKQSNKKRCNGCKPMLLLHNVVGKCEHFKNIDYAGYTERFQFASRHLNALLRAFGTINGFRNYGYYYKALDLLGDMRKGIWKEASLGSNVTIYRRNLQRAYIERMSYLMKEEIKSGRPSDYYNVAQSDVRGLVRGELTTLKSALSIAKTKVVHPKQNTMKMLSKELI
jgi:hypothetical protein